MTAPRMFKTYLIYIFITTVVTLTFADEHEHSQVPLKYLPPSKGTDGHAEGFDLFYYDGQSIRDEKWRYDPKTGSTMVSRRNGFREMDNFHLVDATLDALGSFTKAYKMKNEKDFFKNRVKEPQINKDGDNVMNKAVMNSNGFSGVSINTQYSTQNGFPQLSNVVGIQHLNTPNLYNGLNFQQAFATPGFGFQQQGSLFNHQGQFSMSNQSPFPHNPNFQLSSFLIPFFNQHHSNQQTLGSFPSFTTPSTEEVNLPNTSQQTVHPQVPGTEQQHITSTIKTPDTSENIFPDIPHATELPEHQSTIGSSVNIETTIDPTSNFDIRFEKDRNETNENVTTQIQTSSRRPVEGLPTSDEETEEGVLDDKIGQNVLKTLVG